MSESATFAGRLRALEACDAAVQWVGDRDLATAWAECERGDWMLRLARWAGVDRRIRAQVACEIARTVLHLVRPEDREVCERAIATREAWCRGEATEAECVASASAASAAWAAWAAREAEEAAGKVTMDTSPPSAASAASAAWAAEEAAEAAAEEAAWAAGWAAGWAASATSLKSSAEIVRRHIPVEMIEVGI